MVRRLSFIVDGTDPNAPTTPGTTLISQPDHQPFTVMALT